MAQGDARAAGFTQWQWHLGDRDDIQPLHAQIVGKLAHVSLLVDNPGIQHIVNRRALALRGIAQHLVECGKVLASGAAGGFDQ